MFQVELLKQVQEMLWVHSDLSDWDSDDKELVEVHAAGITGRNASAKTPHINICDNACMDHKDLPEHLQPLMEWIVEDISTQKRKGLQGPFMSTGMYSVVA